MFETLNQMAERTATSVSRRQFLGRFGRAAAGAAGALGSLLLIPGDAQAARKCHGQICPPTLPNCCKGYDVEYGGLFWYCSTRRC